MSAAAQTGTAARWWGRFRARPDAALAWRLGGTRVWIERRPQEWRVSLRIEQAGFDETSFESGVAVEPGQIPADAEVRRFASSGDDHDFALAAALADRPVVIRPERPITLLPQESVQLFVSTPVWLRLEIGGRPVAEWPSFRPSDTWLGPSTVKGQLCYASRTRAVLDAAQLGQRVHRAITCVRLRNRADDPLPLERISVPVGRLGVFAAPSGQLWTEGLTITRTTDAEGFADLSVDSAPPALADARERLCGPREAKGGAQLFRAFGVLFPGTP